MMVNGLLVALVNGGLAAVSVYPAPAMSMERSLNVARPSTAPRVLVPLRVPPEGFVPIATVTDAVLLVYSLFAPTTRTVTAGVIVAPAGVSDGWVTKMSFASFFSASWMSPSDVGVPLASVLVEVSAPMVRDVQP